VKILSKRTADVVDTNPKTGILAHQIMLWRPLWPQDVARCTLGKFGEYPSMFITTTDIRKTTSEKDTDRRI